MNILVPVPDLSGQLLTLLNQQPSLEHFAQDNGIDLNWLLTLYGDLRRGHQPTIMQGELEQLARALGKTAEKLLQLSDRENFYIDQNWYADWSRNEDGSLKGKRFNLEDLRELRKRWGTDKPAVPRPAAGQIYRHRKHDPNAGKWHEYEVIAVVNAGSPPRDAEGLYTYATHTESGKAHGLLAKGGFRNWWCTPVLNECCVLYRSTKGKNRWLRPLSMFTDGRFTLVENNG